MKTIYLAGGCFWGVQEYFSRIPGVLETEAGYANGSKENPSYEEVCTGNFGHAETVRIGYDPARVSLAAILQQYFKIIDPVSVNRQGGDSGVQYRTGIYYVDEADLPEIHKVYDAVQTEVGKPLAVELQELASFWSAEEYHQDYLKKNPGGYCHVSFDSLRDLEPAE